MTTADRRTIFVIPRDGVVYVGTTDTDWQGGPDDVTIESADIQYLLETVHHFFADAHIKPQDIIATWAGLRPLIAQQGVSESQVSREHEVRVETNGLVTIAGGKLTTYRLMAAQVVDRLLRSLAEQGRPLRPARSADTRHEPLPGAMGWPGRSEPRQVAEIYHGQSGTPLPIEVVHNLVASYGMRGRDLADLAVQRPELARPLVEGRPEIMAQVEWGVTQELAVTLGDMLMRRMPLYFQDVHQGLLCAPVVADHMAGLLGWDKEREADELRAYRQAVARSRGWRESSEETT